MNEAAQLVIRVVSAIAVLFALAMVVYPIFRIAVPDNIDNNFNLALGGLLGVIAKTGIDKLVDMADKKKEKAEFAGDPPEPG